MTEKKAIICPNCGKMVSNYVDQCPHCGITNPAGKSKLVKVLGGNRLSFVNLLIWVNVGIFILSYFVPLLVHGRFSTSQGLFGIPAPSGEGLSLLGWANINSLLRYEWWVLVTAIFLHGGPLHIAMNMLWIKNLGPTIESLLSPQKLLIIFIFSGMLGNFVSVYLPFYFNQTQLAQSLYFNFGLKISNWPVVGASGAVFGLMGALISYGYKRRDYWGKHIVRQVGSWAIVLIVLGFLFPSVSNLGHIGGLVGGLIIGRLIAIRDNFTNRQLYTILSLLSVGVFFYSFLMVFSKILPRIG